MGSNFSARTSPLRARLSTRSVTLNAQTTLAPLQLAVNPKSPHRGRRITPAKTAMAYGVHVLEWNIELQRDLPTRRTFFFLIYSSNIIYIIYTFQRDTQCSSTDCLLMHRCQLYMFRTVTVHPQELFFRCCMCRLWYVVRNTLSGTSRWCNVWGRTLYQRDVPDSAVLTTYHSLHIQHLKRSSWGWTVTVRNMLNWHLCSNKQSVPQHCVSRWNAYILQRIPCLYRT